MKRLAIYAHYHFRGEVPEYVPYCLAGLLAVVDRVLVVVNGELTDEGRGRLEALDRVDLLVRENRGFDFAAYKAGLEWFGYDRAAELDELLLTNNSYYGPVYPFTEMWSAMDRVECDFWGLTRHPDQAPEGLVEHLQSYWLVFRAKPLRSTDFRAFWDQLPERALATLDDAIALGEMRLTAYFRDRGYVPAEYVDPEISENRYNPLFVSDLLVTRARCPVIKKKFFFAYKEQALLFRNGRGPADLMAYLAANGLYDCDLIWDDLLATCDLSALSDSLALTHVLPSGHSETGPAAITKQAVAVVSLFDESRVGRLLDYLNRMPAEMAKIVVTADQPAEEAGRRALAAIPNLSFRRQPGRGSEPAALWVTCRDVFDAYRYVCVAPSAPSLTTPQAAITGDEFREHGLRSLIFSEKYVENILNLFETNPRLGLLLPARPLFAGYDAALFEPWGGAGDNVKNFLEGIGLPWDHPDPGLIYPLGSMYWARTEALAALARAGLTYDDFSPESEPESQTRSAGPALERSLALIAQRAGYYSAFVAPDVYAGSLLTNALFRLRLDARQRREQNRASSREMFQDLHRLRRQYLRYRILARILFGWRRLYYRHRKNMAQNELKRLRALIERDLGRPESP